MIFLLKKIFISTVFSYIEASRSAGAQSVNVSETGCGSIPTRGNEMIIYIYFFLGFLPELERFLLEWNNLNIST